MALLEPFRVSFPVDFRHEGDTTKDAFGKHIQEIERIYGIINAVNADKLSAEEFTTKLQQHIGSNNPHPNLEPGTLGGNLPFSRITGNLDASRVAGTLTNANVNTGNVNGLSAFVKELINTSVPSIGDFSCGPTGDDGNYVHGYANFSTGCQIRFGRHPIADYGDYDTNERTLRQHNFAQRFTNHCAAIMLTLSDDDNTVSTNKNWVAMLHNHGNLGFDYHMEQIEPYQSITNMEIEYIAIGH